MKLEKELSEFKDWAMMNRPSAGMNSMWLILLTVNNMTGWKEWFSFPNQILQQLSGLSKQGLNRARNSLIQAGLIQYRKGKPSQAGQYKINYFTKEQSEKLAPDSIKDSTKTDAYFGTISGTITGTNYDTNSHTNNRTIKKETNSGTNSGTITDTITGPAAGTFSLKNKDLKDLKDLKDINNLKDIKEKRDIVKNETNLAPFSEILDLYHNNCPSLPKVRELTPQRKKILQSRWQQKQDLEYFQQLFTLAEESNFLSGRDGKWTGCSFDWLIKETNALKVLEGNYANRDSPKSQSQDEFPNMDQKTKEWLENLPPAWKALNNK